MIVTRRNNKPAYRRRTMIFNWRGLDAMTDAELLNFSETQLQFAVVTFLQDNYPNVPFKCDTSAVKMKKNQARKMKRLGNTRAWPDLFVALPNHGFHGLFVELKRDGTKLYKADQIQFATEHIREQAEVLQNLKNLGYCAQFSVGWKETKRILTGYLPGMF